MRTEANKSPPVFFCAHLERDQVGGGQGERSAFGRRPANHALRERHLCMRTHALTSFEDQQLGFGLTTATLEDVRIFEFAADRPNVGSRRISSSISASLLGRRSTSLQWTSLEIRRESRRFAITATPNDVWICSERWLYQTHPEWWSGQIWSNPGLEWWRPRTGTQHVSSSKISRSSHGGVLSRHHHYQHCGNSVHPQIDWARGRFDTHGRHRNGLQLCWDNTW